jgi:hypothetical protein
MRVLSPTAPSQTRLADRIDRPKKGACSASKVTTAAVSLVLQQGPVGRRSTVAGLEKKIKPVWVVVCSVRSSKQKAKQEKSFRQQLAQNAWTGGPA